MTLLTAPTPLPTEQAACDICGAAAVSRPIASGWDFEYATTREEFRIVGCTTCGLWYVANRPTENAMSVIYPATYYSFSESKHENPLVKMLRDRLEAAKARTYSQLLKADSAAVLDVGCGDGRMLTLLKKHCPPGWTYSGIEFGAEAAARARASGFSVEGGNIETLDLPSWAGKFDLILMHQVLEHTRSPRQALRKVRALLKPGGVFSIETPDTVSWDSRLFQKRYWGGYHIPRHFYLFNKPNLARLLKEEGFGIHSQKSILSPVFWIHSLHNVCADHPSTSRLAGFFHYQNALCLGVATLIDIAQTSLFGMSSNMQVLARKEGV